MRTSDLLEQGRVYTRHELRELFGIADKTMDTGIFKPGEHDSVWLFVTEDKPSEMTDYVDRLDGDTLYWQGQTAGLKDAQIIEHADRGLELVLFYRPKKDAYPGYGFRLEGTFEYVSHSGEGPTSFVLRRVAEKGPRPEDSAVAHEPGGSRAPEDCLIDVLARLRQSGRDSVVAEGSLTSVQRRMHVPDRVEDWVAERISRWRQEGRAVPLLVVLSGNAGDGKSDLIERLHERPEVRGDDLDVVADATHAESPSQSQAQRLVTALELFDNEPSSEGPSERCVLIAMNVGMVIAFFAALEGSPNEQRFSRLRALLEARLGLAREPAEPPSHWDCEVVNLDHRNILGRNHDGLLAGMLGKLDPEEPGSPTYDAARACAACPARGSCWVRTNLSLTRLPAVRHAIHELLWEVTLGSDLHLSPRNMWDLLFQATTGGLELPETAREGDFLSCEWMRENLPSSAQELSSQQLTLVHRRLIYHLLFEPPHPRAPSRGPILDALAVADPIRRGGKHTHLAEGEVLATPRADSEELSQVALEADEPNGADGRRPDPLIDGLASLVTDPLPWQQPDDRNARDLALGVSRRARLTGIPSEVYEEVSNDVVRAFLELLHEYAGWHVEETAPPAVNEFWLTTFVGGVRHIFGVEVHDKTYFRLDTLSPATRFPAYVPVDLREKLSIRPDPVANAGADWLDAVAYIPRSVTATVDTGGEKPWVIPVDLQLYKLLTHVSRGYSASSVDLEAFFRLRYACERLGATDASGEIIFRAASDGQVSRLRREQQLAGWKTEFGLVDQ